MKRSIERILTTHVGSLIRPQALQAFLRAKQSGKAFDANAYAACLTESVATIVRRQAEAGVDVISDGEFGKSISWSQYALERLSGFERRPVQPGANPFQRGADRQRFAEFYAELDAREEMATSTDAICIGPIAYTGQAELARDIKNFKVALEGVKLEEAFLPVAAPASVIPDRKNEYYRSDEECLAAIAAAMRTEYKMIVDAGFVLQLDDARTAVTYDRSRRASSSTATGSPSTWRCSTTRSRACRPSACAITFAGEAGRDRTPPTCRSRISSTSSSR
jgi:5-methyltetrahydropteroyltriglutamate--homocysteine methyltransferase